MKEQLVIVGASGHGRVILDIALKNGYEVLGFLDDDKSITKVEGYPVLGSIESVLNYKDTSKVIIAIGSNSIRRKMSELYQVHYATLIHPSVIIGRDVSIGEGTVIMPNTVINSSAKIGKHCIINTGVIIEHDNQIEDYVHISPGVVLAGTVHVGTETHIGIGACVRNNISICGESIIGAGAVVVKDIRQPGVYMGVPAKARV